LTAASAGLDYGRGLPFARGGCTQRGRLVQVEDPHREAAMAEHSAKALTAWKNQGYLRDASGFQFADLGRLTSHVNAALSLLQAHDRENYFYDVKNSLYTTEKASRS
jgi:hypothetical protein